jgi:hypothetical protein
MLISASALTFAITYLPQPPTPRMNRTWQIRWDGGGIGPLTHLCERVTEGEGDTFDNIFAHTNINYKTNTHT